MSVEVIDAVSQNDIEIVAKLANVIWKQHFTPIIGEAQVEYMLENFQSSDAIKSQIINGSQYYLAKIDEKYIGYAGIIPDLNERKMMLSKIYIKDTLRGKGVGKTLLDHIQKQCLSKGISSLWLTVNRYNSDTISWYIHQGFNIIDEVKKDIGNGFYMDDFIMEKIILPQT